MALEAVVFPQDLFGFAFKEWCNGGSAWSSNDFCELVQDDGEKRGVVPKCEMAAADPAPADAEGNWNVNSSAPSPTAATHHEPAQAAAEVGAAARRKRRRARSVKNKEEVESQRMTHIAVERNRRRQMNEYLTVLRSLMPPSYVQKGDQASIVAGAINYVKELEQLLQSLEVQKHLRQQRGELASAFADFFIFPQYSRYFSKGGGSRDDDRNDSSNSAVEAEAVAAADIEVTMVESHANLKVLSARRPKQLLGLVAGLQSLRLVPLHLNVTSAYEMIMYSFNLKVEDDCRCTSVDEIAAAVNRLLVGMQEEAKFEMNPLGCN